MHRESRSNDTRTAAHIFIVAILALVFVLGTPALMAQAGPSVTISPGEVKTVAGNGNPGFSGDGNLATSAEVNGPIGAAVDSSGNIYIADTNNNRVREVLAASGDIVTVVGTGTGGYSGDGGPATAAELAMPLAVAVDSSNNLYIADTFNCIVRKVSGGTISTVAGTVPTGVSRHCGYSGDGGAATSAQLNDPRGVAVDSAGNIYIADTNNQRVREVVAGNISTIIGNGTRGYSGDGGPATSGELNFPVGVSVGVSSTEIYVADSSNNVIREVTTGMISTVAGNHTLGAGYSGDYGPATSAQLNSPSSVVADGAGDLYIADSSNNVVRFVDVATKIITTLTGNGNPGYAGDNGPANSTTEYNTPSAVALDAADDLVIVDSLNNRVRELTGTAFPLTFPKTQVNGSSGPMVVTLTNTGAGTLSFTSMVASTGFAVDKTATTCSATLAPGAMCNIGVDFVPISPANSVTGTLTVNDSAGAVGGMQQVQLSGSTYLVSTTMLTSSPNPSNSGQQVTITATVTNSDSSTPTGMVNFYENGIGIGGVMLQSGVAVYNSSHLKTGTDSLMAIYQGSLASGSSTSNTVMQTVNADNTSTTVMTSNGSVTFGAAVTFTATVTNTTGGATPKGNVQFFAGNTEITAVPLNSSGVATLTYSHLNAGTYGITAMYLGDGDWGPSASNPVSQTVSASGTSTTLMVPGTSTFGSPVTMTATVTPANGLAPYGTVQFLDGAKVITGVNVNSSGTATLTYSNLSRGVHTITAHFLGSTNYTMSTSTGGTITVQ